MYKRILVASDASEGALKAVQTAAELAQKNHASLLVLHAYDAPPLYGAMLGGGLVNGLESYDPALLDEWMAGANQSVKCRTEAALKETGAEYRYVERKGHPAHTIVQTACDQRCDLIVMGSRGMTGIASFFLGSVSDRVANQARCSVLIVR